MNQTLRRIIHPQVRILSEKDGLVEYVASDETLDSYREIIKVDGWRFDQFKKNAPFVDSHNYSTIEKLVGQVVDFKVDKTKRQLIETAKWAVDVAENKLAQIGWRMTVGGYLKAVSVGFWPVRRVSKWDTDKTAWLTTLKELNQHEESGVHTIYLEQQQVELSVCIIGANPSALAKAYKANVISDGEIEMLSMEYGKRETANSPLAPGNGDAAQRRAQQQFLRKLFLIANNL
jgi:hypothetical protein